MATRGRLRLMIAFVARNMVKDQQMMEIGGVMSRPRRIHVVFESYATLTDSNGLRAIETSEKLHWVEADALEKLMPSESIEELTATNQRRRIEHAPNGEGVGRMVSRQPREV